MMNLSKMSHQYSKCDRTYTVSGSLRTHLRRSHCMTWAEHVAIKTGEDPLERRLCGLRSNNLNSHLARVYKVKPAEYKGRFPGAQTCRLTETQIERMRQTKGAQETKNKANIRAAVGRREEAIESGMTLLVCQICSRQSIGSRISHITRTHGMKMNEYRSRFPGHRVQQAQPSQRCSNSRVMKERLKDPAELAAFPE